MLSVLFKNGQFDPPDPKNDNIIEKLAAYILPYYITYNPVASIFFLTIFPRGSLLLNHLFFGDSVGRPLNILTGQWFRVPSRNHRLSIISFQHLQL